MEQINSIYKEDWFNRNNKDTYVGNHSTGLGWGEGLTEYSKFLYNTIEAKNIVNSKSLLSKELYQLIQSVGLQNTSLYISSEIETGRTDGKVIQITNKFSKEFNSVYSKLDIIFGLLLHESCHCLYTDFEYMKNQICSVQVPEPVRYIINLIEDELIEEKFCGINPGYSNFLGKLKTYFFDEKLENEDDDFSNIIYILFGLIRYPKYINSLSSDLLKKYEELFIEIKDIMKKYGCFSKNNPSITTSSFLSANEIYNLIFKFLGFKNKKQNEKDGENLEYEKRNIKTTTSFKDHQNSKSEEEEIKKQIENIIKNKKSVYNKLKDSLKKMSTTGTQKSKYEFNEESRELANLANTEYEDVDCFSGESESISSVVCGTKDQAKYNSIKQDIKKYIKDFQKIIVKNSKSNTEIYETSKFKKNGNLDSTRLANAKSGELNVYTQKIPIINKREKPKYAFVILLDESGSMSLDDNFEYSSKLGVLFYEAMKKYDSIETYVYGHGDSLITYVDKHNKNKYSLGTRQMQLNQSEKISYAMLIEKIREQTKLPTIVVNITDSIYLTNYDEIKRVVDDAKKKNIYFTCISLGTDSDSNSSEVKSYVIETNNKIYGEKNYLYWEDRQSKSFKKLSTDFAKTFKRIAKI